MAMDGRRDSANFEYKLRESRGVSMVEMLCATAILLLLALVLNTGLHMAMESYRRMVLQSETEILMSTLTDALADELRYASAVATETATNKLEKYNSQLYGDNARLSVSGGEVYIASDSGSSFPVLSTGAYGGATWVYGVERMDIKYSGGLFTVDLTVREMKKDRTFVSSGFNVKKDNIQVRCLNPSG